MNRTTETIEQILTRQNRALRDQLAECQEEIRQLRAELNGGSEPMPAWVPYMTPREEELFRFILKRGEVSNQFLCGKVPDHIEEPSNYVKVYICKIRARLKPSGVKIVTRWGRGYSLDLSGLDAATKSAA